MNGPAALIDRLTKHGYNPRSDAHSNAICIGLLNDLLDHCAEIRAKAIQGELVAQLNHTVIRGHERWNLDMSLGPPPTVEPPQAGEKIRFAAPVVIQIAVEAKGLMTEHGKARHNRLRDLAAFHSHAHNYDRKVVAAGIMVVNISEYFWSPTRGHGDITVHRNIQRLGRDTVELFRNLRLRDSASDSPGLEALGMVVVKHDNIEHNSAPPPGAPTPERSRLVSGPPAPASGDPLHYAALVHRICAAYRERWA